MPPRVRAIFEDREAKVSYVCRSQDMNEFDRFSFSYMFNIEYRNDYNGVGS